jgi:ParB family chromosome partitioning protein
MGKKLFEKAGLVGMPQAVSRPAVVSAGAAGAPAVPDGRPAEARAADPGRPKTAPGTMLGFMTAQSAAIHEADQLRARLVAFEGASPARRLDPALVVPSRWANRHERSYADEAFAQLKADIAAAGAVGVGPSNSPAPAVAARYEIVFGHRRHRACLELGLPVLAVIDELSEQDLFVEMERENRARKDLSAWEQGAMYARALDQGLYPSNRQLALAIGRDLGDVGKALSLARLPKVVIDAFGSPLELQFRWAKPLSDAQQQDPEGLIARATALRERPGKPNARQVLDALLGTGQGVGPSNPLARPLSNPPVDSVIEHGGKPVAVVSTDSRGRTHVLINVVLDEARRKKLHKLLDGLLP